METIFLSSYIFQVVRRVVQLITVLVVDGKPLRARTDKGCRNQGMNEPRNGSVIDGHVGQSVALRGNAAAKYPSFHGTGTAKRSFYSALVAHAVMGLKAHDRSPFLVLPLTKIGAGLAAICGLKIRSLTRFADLLQTIGAILMTMKQRSFKRLLTFITLLSYDGISHSVEASIFNGLVRPAHSLTRLFGPFALYTGDRSNA